MTDVEGEVPGAVEQAHRRAWGRVVASTARLLGDLDAAEECAQDAFVDALETWPARGIPRNPDAWLTTAARRRAIDRVRRAATLRRKLPLLVEVEPEEPMAEDAGPVTDELLRLVFTCCHPALGPEARVALTLRLVCGITTPDVAAVLLVSEPTAAARITRAKKKIALASIPYRVPRPEELPARLDGVLTVVHLVGTLGHTAPGGTDVGDPALAERALHLARALVTLMPDEREARGLLGLLLLTYARRAARTDADGELVLLEDQDRTSWDADEVAEGLRWTAEAAAPRPGRFALQAAIAACHAEAPTFAATDWHHVVTLHDALLDAWPSPVVRLNRAAAVAFSQGPEAALLEVEALEGDPHLRGYHYLPAARAELLRRLGRHDEAAAAYREALALCGNETERRHLTRRLTGPAAP